MISNQPFRTKTKPRCPDIIPSKWTTAVSAELTATSRVGFHRYTFPETDKANIVLDLKWRDKVLDSELKIVGNNRIEGYRRSSSWAKDQIVYFVAEFSKPFVSRKIAVGDDDKNENLFIFDNTNNSGADKKNVKASFQFKTKANEQILVKVAISPVSIEGAGKNLAEEIPDWDFEKVRNDAKTAWNKELSTNRSFRRNRRADDEFLYRVLSHENSAEYLSGC